MQLDKIPTTVVTGFLGSGKTTLLSTVLRQAAGKRIAVIVNEWDDGQADKPIYIQADIWVERKNHRMMVLGKGGKMIREIGKMARKQLEVFLSRQVFLDQQVLVREDWRDDIHALRELGYE